MFGFKRMPARRFKGKEKDSGDLLLLNANIQMQKTNFAGYYKDFSGKFSENFFDVFQKELVEILNALGFLMPISISDMERPDTFQIISPNYKSCRLVFDKIEDNIDRIVEIHFGNSTYYYTLRPSLSGTLNLFKIQRTLSNGTFVFEYKEREILCITRVTFGNGTELDFRLIGAKSVLFPTSDALLNKSVISMHEYMCTIEEDKIPDIREFYKKVKDLSGLIEDNRGSFSVSLSNSKETKSHIVVQNGKLHIFCLKDYLFWNIDGMWTYADNGHFISGNSKKPGATIDVTPPFETDDETKRRILHAQKMISKEINDFEF